MVKAKKLEIIAWVVIIGCMIIGGILGVYIIERATGEFHYNMVGSIIIGTLSGPMVFFLISKWNKKRKGKVPEVDERSIFLMKRYFLIVLYVVLIGSGAALVVLYALGVHTIETGMLIVYMMVLYLLIGMGAMVTKRL